MISVGDAVELYGERTPEVARIFGVELVAEADSGSAQ